MVEPGDLCKYMSQPWHTDYNSCATHTPDPNPVGNNTLHWSWPAQRPVNVYPKSGCSYDAASATWNLGGQVFSVRGNEGHGTATPYPQQQGRCLRQQHYRAERRFPHSRFWQRRRLDFLSQKVPFSTPPVP
jgi:hypothetical protein